MSLERLKETIRTSGVVLSLHAQQEAAVEAIGYDEIGNCSDLRRRTVTRVRRGRRSLPGVGP